MSTVTPDGIGPFSVVHAPDLHRYEVREGDTVAGFAEYVLPDDQHVDFVHTVVEEAYAGHGLAGQLVSFALADVRAQGKRIIAHCPYVQSWLRKHPEYDALVDPAE